MRDLKSIPFESRKIKGVVIARQAFRQGLSDRSGMLEAMSGAG